MRRRDLLLALSAGPLLAAAAKGAPIGYSRSAMAVLTRARAAAGGNGWNMLRGWHETGLRGGRPYEAWYDPVRYGLRTEVKGPDGLLTTGFNGLGQWEIRPDGVETGADRGPPIGAARTEAFLAVDGFFFPGRFDAQADALPARREAGRGYDVVRVSPYGGWARELWFDARTHLLAKIVDRSGPKPVTVLVSDHRKVGPVKVAFRYRLDGGDGTAPEDRQIQSLVFTPADRTMFSFPRKP